MSKKTKSESGVEQQERLKNKIVLLGGIIPAPNPWVVIRKTQRGTVVDTAAYNLQLLETIEELEAKVYGGGEA